MIVASRTIDRNAHRRGDDLRDHVIKIASSSGSPQHFAASLHLAHKIPRTGGKKPECGYSIRRIGRDHITGDLFGNKLIVGFVGVQRCDHIIAITPRMGAKLIAFETVSVGIVCDIKPVPCPSLAIMWRGEQLVDERFIFFVRHWSSGYNVRRRQADQVEMQSTIQRASVGGRRHYKAALA